MKERPFGRSFYFEKKDFQFIMFGERTNELFENDTLIFQNQL